MGREIRRGTECIGSVSSTRLLPPSAPPAGRAARPQLGKERARRADNWWRLPARYGDTTKRKNRVTRTSPTRRKGIGERTPTIACAAPIDGDLALGV